MSYHVGIHRVPLKVGLWRLSLLGWAWSTLRKLSQMCYHSHLADLGQTAWSYLTDPTSRRVQLLRLDGGEPHNNFALLVLSACKIWSLYSQTNLAQRPNLFRGTANKLCMLTPTSLCWARDRLLYMCPSLDVLPRHICWL